MGRLETVTKDSSVVESYGYDLNGTRISETNTLRGITRPLSYNDEDHLLTAGSATYTYDLDGLFNRKGGRSGLNNLRLFVTWRTTPGKSAKW